MANDNANPMQHYLPADISVVYVDHSTKSLNLRRRLGHTHALIFARKGLNVLLTTASYLACVRIASLHGEARSLCVVPLEYVKERK